MREHEIQLIADLVAGRLDAESEAEARALLASSSELRAEYESQLAVFDALTAVGTASLTNAERATLHREVWTGLRKAPATSRRVPWFYRLAAPVVGGMFIVVGLVAVLNQGSGADSSRGASSDLTNAESAGGAVTTTAADAAAEATFEESSEGSAGDGTASPSALLPSGPTAEDLARALSPAVESFYAAEAEKVRADEVGEADYQSLDDSLIDSFQECTEEVGLVDFTLIATRPDAPEKDGGLPPGAVPFFAAVPAGSDLRAAPIVFLDAENCELIYIDD